MKRYRAIAWGVAVIVFAAVAAVLATTTRSANASDGEVPLAPVQRGELDIRVYATGELKATQAMVLTAPPVAGGALQITRLLHAGAPVKKGDIVFEFDPAEQLYKLEQSRSELLQAEQEIVKAKADAAVQAAQDKVDLLKARFALRQAELEVQKNELVSVIDGKKNELALEQAKASLAKLQQDIESHTASGQATIALALEKKNKARLAMDQAQQNIEKMHVTAPMDGLVSIERNTNTMGGIMWTGMAMPDYRAGDQVQPGSSIAQIIDSSVMELTSKIGEQDRDNVKVGQPAEVEFDALAGRIFHGMVKAVGGMSTRQFWEVGNGGKFDITVELTDKDQRLRPGLTAQIVIVGDKRKDALYVPRQALFMKDGKRVVYLRNGKGFEQREIKIQCENESRAAIQGLKVDDQVALLDPTAPRKAASGLTPEGGEVTR
ncbi:MAG TPA: efflux RND transporter periplasmic adaptor subunit [Terriglobales bacterium]|nr:efflux RND transporter periplasmic adaptor subunit [Terriglobales bacterium]